MEVGNSISLKLKKNSSFGEGKWQAGEGVGGA